MIKFLKNIKKIDLYETIKNILTFTILFNLFLFILDFGNFAFNIFFLFSLIAQIYTYYINF